MKDEEKSHDVLDIKYTYYKSQERFSNKGKKMTAPAQERQKQNRGHRSD